MTSTCHFPPAAPFRRLGFAWQSAAAALALISMPAASLADGLLEQISYRSIKAPNACLPDAIGFQNAYKVHQRMRQSSAWSRVLMVQSRVRPGAPSHAFCVFSLEGKLWAYDQSGGCRRVWVSAAEKGDAMKVGRMLAPDQFDRALWIDQSF